ncbi:type IV secretory system conjugative DNA transfer family protein, partial [Patescibacteria group bacterium]
MAIPKPQPYDHDHENEVTVFAATNFRSEPRKFGIKTDDRRRHMYVIGKTGMGKTTLLENMVLSDIHAGHGVTYIDPHGDTAKKILDYIPPHRINDVVYFNPSDLEHPVGFNVLESIDDDKKHLVAAGLMGVFKKIWPDVWSARMEYILLNTIMAILDYPGGTLMGMNRLLSDKEYRKKVVAVIQDPVVKSFWVKEFASFTEKYATEAVAPVQNKIGQFLSAGVIRNIVAQTKSTIDMRDIMDNRKIFIVNLSKGAVGEENSRLLGGMLITRLQLAAMERVDIPNEEDRQDFYLYVDEFQNFATESFANILSEARKYRLNLIMAHQYIEQLDETVAAAIFGNVGTIISFRVGASDAEPLAKEFAPQFVEEDLVNLGKFDVYLKLMIDGASSQPFSASTLPPIAQRTGSMDKVIKVSRERYGRLRSIIEDRVLRWSSSDDDGEDKGTTIDKTPEQIEIEKQLEVLGASSPKISGPPQKGDKKPIVAEMACTVCGKISKLLHVQD